MNSLTFKTINLANADQLIEIENQCHSHPWSKKTFISCIGGRYIGEFALNKKQEIIGFYVGDHVADEATLMDICVMPTKQGKGFGNLLLSQFIMQTKQFSVSKIFLEVRVSNISAQMLYIQHNFIEISRRTGYYPSAKGFGYEDAIVMCLTL
ncbi:MAG: ribosomal protein S18-alanine N-acetyltransferase [Woeseiaceae bacterium]